MAFIRNRGAQHVSRVLGRRDDLAVVGRIVWTCILRASPRRAWLTLALCLETAWRRPRAIREAFTLALMHKHFHEYVQDTSRQLEALTRGLRESEPVAAAAPSAERRGRLIELTAANARSRGGVMGRMRSSLKVLVALTVAAGLVFLEVALSGAAAS
jgi:uncharacterized protein DUF4070